MSIASSRVEVVNPGYMVYAAFKDESSELTTSCN